MNKAHCFLKTHMSICCWTSPLGRHTHNSYWTHSITLSHPDLFQCPCLVHGITIRLVAPVRETQHYPRLALTSICTFYASFNEYFWMCMLTFYLLTTVPSLVLISYLFFGKNFFMDLGAFRIVSKLKQDCVNSWLKLLMASHCITDKPQVLYCSIHVPYVSVPLLTPVTISLPFCVLLYNTELLVV